MLFLFCFFLLIFATSCSNEQSVWTFDTDTLRTEASTLEEHTPWTGELESSLLSGKLSSSTEGISKNITLSPALIFASGAEDSYTPIYPALEGFATLNTSLLPQEALATLDGFCKALINDAVDESFLARDALFEYVLFAYDMKKHLDATSALKKYILGEPFVSEDFIQCPVRFYRQNERTMDIVVYMTAHEGGWKICKLHFKKGEGE